MKNMIIMLAVLMSSNVFANYCATIYQGQDLTGASMDIAEGEEIRNLGELLMDPYEGSDWDNKISSVVVNSECRLVTYQYQNLGSCTPNAKNGPFRKLADEGSLLYSGGIPTCK